MSIRVFTVVLVASLVAALAPATADILPTPPGWQIERAVLLSRHGVRSPTATNEQLDRYSATAWPTWPVEPGFLSPRGEELMRLMGGYYRVLYGGRGLVQADDCPTAGTVAAWTDLAQRTRTSGAAILAGMYPRCANLPLRNQANFTLPDPLFHPQPTASCPMNLAANRAAIMARLGGSFASVQRDYAGHGAGGAAGLCGGSGQRCLPARGIHQDRQGGGRPGMCHGHWRQLLTVRDRPLAAGRRDGLAFRASLDQTHMKQEQALSGKHRSRACQTNRSPGGPSTDRRGPLVRWCRTPGVSARRIASPRGARPVRWP